MTEGEVLYRAAQSRFGVIVRGSAKKLREVRSELREDPALADLLVLGPDPEGLVWIVRKSTVRRHVGG